MLNDREKLIELIGYGKKKCGESLTCRECEYDYGGANCIDQMTADHLIANGVTVQKKGEWELLFVGNYKCSLCGCIPYYAGNVHTLSFCPRCGADMRGEEHDHDEVWEAAFDAIFNEYSRICEEMFPKKDGENDENDEN